ncbi:hypothetical protein [Streptomyces sp. NPDC095602]|uniref:hypothetical protein n=1 Tax=unclassified Streptomyces TaxID=2593676 RepID=UPI0033247FF6
MPSKYPPNPTPPRVNTELALGTGAAAVTIVIFVVAGVLTAMGMRPVDVLLLLGGAGLIAVVVVRLSTARGRRLRRAYELIRTSAQL